MFRNVSTLLVMLIESNMLIMIMITITTRIRALLIEVTEA